MKTLNALFVTLVALFSLNACTPKMNFTTSTIVPAATGGVTVRKDKNANYAINVNVQNLADPKRLTPAKETYIVWMESANEATKKLGQIKPASKALKGTLKATDIAKPTDIFITAEDNADVQYPDGQIVLTTKK